MSLVPSLLHAIVKVDGEAMVMHAGDKPYVVSPTGQVELASRGLTLEAVNGIVGQLLPHEIQSALEEFGAIQYELSSAAEFPGEHFTVVAARGGDDLWVEIRRRRTHDDHVPEELFTHASPRRSAPPPAAAPAAAPPPLVPPAAPVAPAPAAAADVAQTASASAAQEPGVAHTATANVAHPAVPEPSIETDLDVRDELATLTHTLDEAQPSDDPPRRDEDLVLPDATQLWPTPSHAAVDRAVQPPQAHAAAARQTSNDDFATIELEDAVVMQSPEPGAASGPRAVAEQAEPAAVAEPEPVAPEERPVAREERPPVAREEWPVAREERQPVAREERPVAREEPQPVAREDPEPVVLLEEPEPVAFEEPTPAIVLPIARSPIRAEAPPPLVQDVTLSGLERLLRLSSARGASTLYLSSESRPSVRVDGELQSLDGEPVHTSRDVESLLLTLMPERSHEVLRTGALTEWICEIEGVGRVRCMSFRDHHGPGGVFRLMPTRSVSVEQLGLPKHVQALAIEPEGLVLVAGPRSSGKRTLMAAFVDLMNRTRRDHIITIEREINIVHERGSSFISQREVRGDDDEIVAAARGALREDPDVLVIEELQSGPLMNVALEAAASGRLVVGGFSAHTAAGAIDRIIDLYAPEYRRQVQFALADSLRGVIVQVLLRKIGGGRLPAREVLLNTPAVSSLIAEGKTSQLPMAIEGGRRYGMMPMNDALVGLVHSGAVEGRDAYRQSTDRPALLAALNRQGIDTSFVERLA